MSTIVTWALIGLLVFFLLFKLLPIVALIVAIALPAYGLYYWLKKSGFLP